MLFEHQHHLLLLTCLGVVVLELLKGDHDYGDVGGRLQALIISLLDSFSHQVFGYLTAHLVQGDGLLGRKYLLVPLIINDFPGPVLDPLLTKGVKHRLTGHQQKVDVQTSLLLQTSHIQYSGGRVKFLKSPQSSVTRHGDPQIQ